MSDPARTCRLCYTELEIFDTNEGVILRCGCALPLIKAPTVEAAYQQLDVFELELTQGANLWGSKIQNGITED